MKMRDQHQAKWFRARQKSSTMKQLKVSLSDDLRDQLDEIAAKRGVSLSEEVRDRLALLDEIRARVEPAANKSGHSFAEEIGERLERTFADDAIDAETRKFTNAIGFLAGLINGQTGHAWYSHPAAASVMKHAIDALLARFNGGDGKAEFLQEELPPKESRSLIADNSREMGIAMATVVGLVDDIAAGRTQLPGWPRGMIQLDAIMASVGKKPKGEER
jgi:predicted transcriptional regulator